ncbi:hypothetical protein McpSp1_13740 [Methanocorpusculaceae archaeon Sp1]|nr:hypothetical protein [Methanocorpusculaceae archaeon Sp1]
MMRKTILTTPAKNRRKFASCYPVRAKRTEAIVHVPWHVRRLTRSQTSWTLAGVPTERKITAIGKFGNLRKSVVDLSRASTLTTYSLTFFRKKTD